MYQMFRAEWLKIAGNRWATTFLMWIFPAGGALVIFFAILAAALSEDFRVEQSLIGIAPWHEMFLSTWDVVNNFIGRWVVLAFTAFVFAGEYKHGTYKNLITHRSRVAIIVMKFVTVAVFVTFSFTLLSLIVGFGTGIVAGQLGLDYGWSTFGDEFVPFMEEYLLQMFTTLTGTFIVATFTAIAAMISKNIMASVIVGILINLFELIGLIIFAGFVNWILDINLYRFLRYMPTFNLENLASWLRVNEPLPLVFGEFVYAAPTLAGSAVILAFWTVVLVSLTTYLFYRQDIQS